MQFCDDCGDLLNESLDEKVKCNVCGKFTKNTMFSQSSTIIIDKFPSVLRTKLTSNVQVVTSKDDDEENARIRKDCPKCAATEMTWSEAQLRSVDEGTTIFFRCPDCGYRFREDN